MDFISIDEIRVGDEVGVVRPLPNGCHGHFPPVFYIVRRITPKKTKVEMDNGQTFLVKNIKFCRPDKN